VKNVTVSGLGRSLSGLGDPHRRMHGRSQTPKHPLKSKPSTRASASSTSSWACRPRKPSRTSMTLRGSRNCGAPTWWTWRPFAQSGRCTDGARRQLGPLHCLSTWAFKNSRFDGPGLQPRKFHQVVGVESGRKDGPLPDRRRIFSNPLRSS
jgi:hypothetical protein